MEQRGWLTPREAASLLGIPLRDLYRLVDDGEVPAHVFGHRLRLSAQAVAGHREPPTDPPADPRDGPPDDPPDGPLVPAVPT